MTDHNSAAPPLLKEPLDRNALMLNLPKARSGARWFFWIAGLSAVNSVIVHSDGGTSFVVGLGFTLLADHFFKEYIAVAIAIDTVALGTLVSLGFAAHRGYLSAYIVGIILYILDAFIYLYFEDWMPLAFHGYALFFMINGAIELRKALQAS